MSFAPGEGNRPLGIFMDKESEFLSFPTIYCGQTRADNKERTTPVHYSTVCKWELRSQDRRVAQSVPNIFYTDDEIKNMTWLQKSDLIQKDPVTCARNFEHMVQLFIKDVLKSNLMPIGEIVDFFYRVEFQQRGSPHIHALFWVKDAPQYEKSCNDTIVQFVDKYITCKNDQLDEMKELVNLQTHRHAKTCKKGGHKIICRFNFPLPPMPKSMILEPLKESHFDEDELNRIKKQWDKIKSLLDEMKYVEDITFEAFLEKVELTESQYIETIRYSLKRPTLLLKRSPSEIRINNYNTNLLKAWRANSLF